MRNVARIALLVLIYLYTLLCPVSAFAEWQIRYTCSPWAQNDENTGVSLGEIYFVPKNTPAYISTTQTVQCTLTWQGNAPAPRFVKITEYAYADGGGLTFVPTPEPTPDPTPTPDPSPDPDPTPTPIDISSNSFKTDNLPQAVAYKRDVSKYSIQTRSSDHPFLTGDAHHRLNPSSLHGIPLKAITAIEDDGYWTWGFCQGLSFYFLSNDRGGTPAPFWFTDYNFDTYRVCRTVKEVFYPVKQVGGSYIVEVAPCDLKSGMGMSGISDYDAFLYSFTEYKVEVEDLAVEVALETPEDESLFRGRPTTIEDDRIGCPILLTGHVRLPDNLEGISDVKLSFIREKINATGEQLDKNDRGDGVDSNSLTLAEFRKQRVAEEQFEGGMEGIVLTPVEGEPNHWTFRAVWNQKLSRTLTKKYDPKNDGTENSVEDGPHYWRIRAEASFKQEVVPANSDGNVYHPAQLNTAEIESEGKQIRIFCMAYPVGNLSGPSIDPVVSGGVGSFGDYFEVDRAATGAVPLVSVAIAPDNNGQSVSIPITYLSGGPGTPGGPHLAVDYPANGGTVLRASEVGEIRLGEFKAIDISSSTSKEDAETLLATMKEWRSKLGHDETQNVNDLFDCYFYKLDRGGLFDNGNILGPHLIMVHSQGKADAVKSPIRLRLLTDDMYEIGSVESLYAHLQTDTSGTPTILTSGGIGSVAEISSPLCVTGESGTYNEMLRLGYFTSSKTVIAIYKKNRPVSEENLVTTVSIGSLNIPSITGSHLHFQVHVRERANKNSQRNNKAGQQNPHQWLKSIKPGNRIEPFSTRD